MRQRNQYAGEFTVYFVSQLSKPFAEMGSWEVGEYHGTDTNYGTEWRLPRAIRNDVATLHSKTASGIWLTFKTVANEIVTVRTGTSLVGGEQARKNLEMESAPFAWDFGAVSRTAFEQWNTLLKRVEVEGGSEDDRVKLYTNLYRAYSSKPGLEDVDGSYRDACGEVRKLEAPADHVYSSDAMWGAQWTLGPLWALLTPEVMSSYTRFMLMEAKRDGWLSYASVNLRYSPIMAAQHEIPMMVGAWQKGVRDFDPEAAYAAMHKSLTVPGEPYTCGGSFPQGFAGDRHLRSYRDLGFVPDEVGPASSTYEYAYDDACAATFARALGKEADAISFEERSRNWRNSFDPAVKYARRRKANGEWVAPFDPLHFGTGGGWNGPGFVEGTPWIYTWFVPHDVGGW